MKELEDNVRSEQIKKSSLCRGCLAAEGPRRHRGIRELEKTTHTLHIDIANPLCPLQMMDTVTSEHLGFQVYHFSLISVLATRRSVEVCDKTERTVALPAAPETEGDACRVSRLRSDRAGCPIPAKPHDRLPYPLPLAMTHRQVERSCEISGSH